MKDQIIYRPFASENKLHFNYRAIMGYANYHLKIFLGVKGVGKTFPMKLLCINRFIFKGSKFLWIRDTNSPIEELEKSPDDFFADIIDYLPAGTVCKLQNGRFYVNGKIAGKLQALSTFYQQKGTEYKEYETVIFDEAIPEKYQPEQKGFFIKLANVLKQTGRLKDGKQRGTIDFIFTANALDRGASILVKFGFKNVFKYGIYLNKTRKAMLVYIEPSKAYEKAVDESIAGMLLKGTEAEDNLNKGIFAGDTDNIIEYRIKSTVKYCIATPDGDFAVERADAPFAYYYITEKKRNTYKNKWYTNVRALATENIKFRKDVRKDLQILTDGAIIEYENTNVRDLFSTFMGG